MYIFEKRRTYLQNILKLRQENKTLIYMDETWGNAHYANKYIWIDGNGKEG